MNYILPIMAVLVLILYTFISFYAIDLYKSYKFVKGCGVKVELNWQMKGLFGFALGMFLFLAYMLINSYLSLNL